MPHTETHSGVICRVDQAFLWRRLLKAVQQTAPLLKGAYAFSVIHRDFPDQIIACAHEAPLIIGIGAQEAFISSDSLAFAAQTREVLFNQWGDSCG